MPIEHLGLNVPDVDAAKAYFDEFLPMVGYVQQWDVGYRPTDWNGAQLFLYPATEPGDHSRLRTGLSHISFLVDTRAQVHRVHDWVVARGDEVLHAPRLFPSTEKRSTRRSSSIPTASISRWSPSRRHEQAACLRRPMG